MTPVKPGDTLIIRELWAVAAAHKLGFEPIPFYDGRPQPKYKKKGSKYRFEAYDCEGCLYDAWCILATETGPNAAERFLPQAGDYCKFTMNKAVIPIDAPLALTAQAHDFNSFDRIVERPHNGEMMPFPKYEVMK